MILDRMKKAVKDKTMASLIEGIRKHRDEIRVLSMYMGDTLREFLETNVIGNPEFFYVMGFKYCVRGNEITVIPSYTYSLQEMLRLSEQCQKIADGLVKRANSHDLYERVKMLHDFLARNVVYEDDGKKERHTIVGSLIEQKAVCDGYSAAFKYLLDRIGVPCVIVTGTAWNQLSETHSRHAWNMVELEDEWTHIDVTFDTTMSSFNIIRYDYFGLTTEKVMRDHNYNESEFPIAGITFQDYYSRHKAVVYGKKEFQRFALNMINNRVLDFVVKLPDDVPEHGLEDKVSTVMKNVLIDNGLSYQYDNIYNKKQKVFQIHLQKI